MMCSSQQITLLCCCETEKLRESQSREMFLQTCEMPYRVATIDKLYDLFG